MAVHMFTNRRIYDSILRRRRLSAQRGTCPVAKKAIFKNCESNQSVICLANANFGLGTGLIATIAGLVLGLLVASANTTYETKSDELEELTANIVLLDTTLAQYGPEANTARNLLRLALKTLADRIWRENRAVHGSG